MNNNNNNDTNDTNDSNNTNNIELISKIILRLRFRVIINSILLKFTISQ